ncbi:MAG TPA: response regulator [Puia sp.]|nr:response regulator [Puia sp.]
MAERLKILLLEDNPSDAEMIRRLLRKENPSCEFCLAMTRESYLKALDDFQPDVILADNSLPQFDARDALQVIRAFSRPIPFILVTGTVSEEFAAAMIKSGADDYLLKDRITRLPAAIKAAIRQRTADNERQDALEEIRISNERFDLLSKATRDAVWDWNLVTGRVWCNEGFLELLGLGRHLPPPPPDEWPTHAHPGDRDKLSARLQGIRTNRISGWQDELRFLSPNGTLTTTLDRAYVIKDDAGNPVRAIGVLVDVTSKIEHQKAIMRAILEAQEKERNAIGRELHDNINQILASVSLKLGYYLEEPDGNEQIIEICKENLHKAIEEGRKLSHHMVMPRFSQRSLREEIELLIEDYRYLQIAWVHCDDLIGKAVPDHLKETLFRIAQEQVNNIHKHAKATRIEIKLFCDKREVCLEIKDNGVGFDVRQRAKGIGITNILNRAESYNGTAEIFSHPGKGCTLAVRIPLPPTH